MSRNAPAEVVTGAPGGPSPTVAMPLSCRRRSADLRRSSIPLYLTTVALLCGCSDDLPSSCPPGRPVLLARAQDARTVAVTFACRIDQKSASDTDHYTIGDYTVSPPVQLAVTGAKAAAEETVLLTTTEQTALVTYTLQIDGVKDDDGASIVASVNFVGVGQTKAAPVTLRVDDRYNASLEQVWVLASVDPLTGVFSHFSQKIPLSDPDGDHVFTTVLPVAVDPARTSATDDDRLGSQYMAYSARAVDAEDRPLSDLVLFEVLDEAPRTVDLPLLSVPPPPPPEGLVTVSFEVDDRPARALTNPSLRGSFDENGLFDDQFPTVIALTDSDNDNVWEGQAKVRLDPQRKLDGKTEASMPYSVYLVEDKTPYSSRSADFVVPNEDPVSVTILVGNKSLVPVTFRVDTSTAWLDVTGTNKGLYKGEAVFLTGEFSVAEDAFGQNATDAFTGGENVVLQMTERQGQPGVWERTIFLPPSRPYGWKVVRCPAGVGCTQLNQIVTSSGRAFPTVMKNLITELCDAGKNSWSDPNCNSPKLIDPRALTAVETGAGLLDYTGAEIFAGTGAGLADQHDPSGTPDPSLMFKQEVPDLVVDVQTDPLATPVYVIGTWRDVNIPGSPADLVAAGTVVDLGKTDYDAGMIGVTPPSYELAPPPPPSPFVMDGQLDSSATLLAGGGTTGGMSLHLAINGTLLYVATDDAGEGSDHFILLSATPPGGAHAAPWGKAGTVAFAGKTLFLADENDNGYAGWFELASPSDALLEPVGGNQDPALDLFTPAVNGGVLEGTVDLAAIFGSLPAMLYVAAAPWGTADGASLYSGAQTPPTVDGDGQIDAQEILKVSLPQLKVVP